MARKLFIMMALVSLALLAQAAPGLAVTSTTYLLESDGYSWLETHGNNNSGNPYPGSTGSALHGSFTAEDGTTWRIGDTYEIMYNGELTTKTANLMNSAQAAADVIDPVNNIVTFQTVYDTIESPGVIKFSVNIPGGPSISSTDATIIMTETFKIQEGAGGLTWTFQSGSIAGSGTSDGIPFTLSGILYETTGDHNHYGGINNFTLTYPAAANAPIPGALWLLGTGLLGLACVGRRRRRS
jgi:hypothetical protein